MTVMREIDLGRRSCGVDRCVCQDKRSECGGYNKYDPKVLGNPLKQKRMMMECTTQVSPISPGHLRRQVGSHAWGQATRRMHATTYRFTPSFPSPLPLPLSPLACRLGLSYSACVRLGHLPTHFRFRGYRRGGQHGSAHPTRVGVDQVPRTSSFTTTPTDPRRQNPHGAPTFEWRVSGGLFFNAWLGC